MFPRVITVLLIGAAAAGASEAPPKFALSIPDAFNVKVSTSHFRKGEVIRAEPEYARLIALTSFSEYFGYFGDPNADQAHSHRWNLAVYRGENQNTLSACRHAKDGYQADLNECTEFLGCGDVSYMFARFERKHFRWGDAVSFLSQFTQDAAYYVPHNGHLTYEVWGITRDHRFTVVARVPVTHAKLAGWAKPDLRDARSLDELKKDRDYKRVERCNPNEFQPSLTAFDQLLDSLVIQ